jgi:hypothetical protein
MRAEKPRESPLAFVAFMGTELNIAFQLEAPLSRRVVHPNAFPDFFSRRRI